MVEKKDTDFTDIIIIGAGLSGIGAACHLSLKNPEKSYRILESRHEIGGTWSLFKYPGVRSDSDMFTFGFSFKLWEYSKRFADGTSIMSYLEGAADEYQISQKITFKTCVTEAHFNSNTRIWSLTTNNTQKKNENKYFCRYLFFCSGYYSYENGYIPDFPGIKNFEGIVVHPQKWPEDLEYSQKKVVIIGSGATAITLMPTMAKQTKEITMLQRSPTYVADLPNEDKVANFLQRVAPKQIAYMLVRFKNICIFIYTFLLCRAYPEKVKKIMIEKVQKQIGDFPARPHFEPSYNPWDQRLCVAPDGDLFEAIKKGKASVVTDHIETFTKTGIKLKSGKELDADIVITATGLNLLPLGGIKIKIDNQNLDITKSIAYKGLMLSGLPNCIVFVGYTNASWTLKTDLTSEYVSRLFNVMNNKGYSYFVPKVIGNDVELLPILDFKSGYVLRSAHLAMKQGSRFPWRLQQNYFLDYITLRINKIEDRELILKH